MRSILIGSLLGMSLFVIKNIFKNENKKDITLQEKLKKEAENIVIEDFMKMIEKNENIILEEAILAFELTECKTLDDYSKIKGRSKKAYIESYNQYFLIAKNKLKKKE